MLATMQQQDAVADGRFAPGAAPWRNRRNKCVIFDSDPFALSCENMLYPLNQKYVT